MVLVVVGTVGRDDACGGWSTRAKGLGLPVQREAKSHRCEGRQKVAGAKEGKGSIWSLRQFGVGISVRESGYC